jgi:hypothetical protein
MSGMANSRVFLNGGSATIVSFFYRKAVVMGNSSGNNSNRRCGTSKKSAQTLQTCWMGYTISKCVTEAQMSSCSLPRLQPHKLQQQALPLSKQRHKRKLEPKGNSCRRVGLLGRSSAHMSESYSCSWTRISAPVPNRLSRRVSNPR